VIRARSLELRARSNSALCKALSEGFLEAQSHPPMDPAEQLQRIYLAGFELQTFDRFPKCIGVVRDGCIALLVPGVDGLQILGTPGWRMGEAIGMLVEKNGRQVFQNKQEMVEATPERLEILARFKTDLKALLLRASGPSGKSQQ
jgi:hypothetical protein